MCSRLPESKIRHDVNVSPEEEVSHGKIRWLQHGRQKREMRAARLALFGWLSAVIAFPLYTNADDRLPIVGAGTGATNPVGASDTNMFRDDELDIMGAARDVVQLRFFPGASTKDDLTAWDFNFSAAPLTLSGNFIKGQVTDKYGNSDYSFPQMAMDVRLTSCDTASVEAGFRLISISPNEANPTSAE